MYSKIARIVAACVTLALLSALAGCSGGATDGPGTEQAPKGPVTIGSKIDTEGELISSIVKLVLEDAGFEVIDKSQTGTTEVVRKAIIAGEIDLYPEYSGNGYWFFLDELTEDQKAAYQSGQDGYDLTARIDLETNDVVWLEPARANNTWALAATEEFAQAEGLETMSDFAVYVNAGRPVKVAASDEFFTSAGNPEFERTYGYTLAEDQKVRLAGGNTAATEKAVADGTDGVNFGMAYGTDGALADLGLVILEDDLGAQIVYWPTPIVRKDVLDAHPEIADLLKPVMSALGLQELQQLNARIQVNGETADTVARDFLIEGGFIE
ncbi:MAG: ABC transporter substrate-binding protein [Coriobacteriia bacterium]|nr:ABC transporter substrate-binding protein [Coriobacteriia bacterium]MBN2841300.1 ABC transporter substrate-binding protein [Coriobacteriia bacterium]